MSENDKNVPLRRLRSNLLNPKFGSQKSAERKLVTIKHFLLNFLGGGVQNVSQNGNFCLYFKNS